MSSVDFSYHPSLLRNVFLSASVVEVPKTENSAVKPLATDGHQEEDAIHPDDVVQPAVGEQVARNVDEPKTEEAVAAAPNPSGDGEPAPVPAPSTADNPPKGEETAPNNAKEADTKKEEPKKGACE